MAKEKRPLQKILLGAAGFQEVLANNGRWQPINRENHSKNLLLLGIQLGTRLTELEGIVQDLLEDIEELMAGEGSEGMVDADFNDDPDY